ncbi:MAG: Uma2 family endonuclease [Ignavibacteriae bacterium]|nr:Uma2 family endonuclease [Ignavibacteriota bacterium]
MSTAPKRYITPEEYLEMERTAPFRSEYFEGQMYPMHLSRRPGDPVMADSAHDHLILGTNVLSELGDQLKSRNYLVVPEAKIQVGQETITPDVCVVHDEEHLNGRREQPVVIIEITSGATQSEDYGWKFNLYRRIESLQEYILVDSERVYADVFQRCAKQDWLMGTHEGHDEEIFIAPLECKLPFSRIYKGTNLE